MASTNRFPDHRSAHHQLLFHFSMQDPRWPHLPLVLFLFSNDGHGGPTTNTPHARPTSWTVSRRISVVITAPPPRATSTSVAAFATASPHRPPRQAQPRLPRRPDLSTVLTQYSNSDARLPRWNRVGTLPPSPPNPTRAAHPADLRPLLFCVSRRHATCSLLSAAPLSVFLHSRRALHVNLIGGSLGR